MSSLLLMTSVALVAAKIDYGAINRKLNFNNEVIGNDFAPEGIFAQKSYSLGDLMNIPSFYPAYLNGWIKTGVNLEPYAREYALAEDTPGILGWYFSEFPDFDNREYQNDGHRYPNVTQLRRSVEMYGQYIQQAYKIGSHSRNNYTKIFFQHLQEVKHPHTLLIHMRTGDKGVFNEYFLPSINYVIQENHFKKVIVMSGLHMDIKVASHENKINNTMISMHRIIGNLTRGGIHTSIHYGHNADDDVFLMSQAANLFVHRGGYSAVGALVCRGEIFFAKDLNQTCGSDPEFMSYIDHPHSWVNLTAIAV